MPSRGPRPDETPATRAVTWAHRLVDVTAGALCAIVVGWVGLPLLGWAAAVLGLGAIGWVVGRRARAVAFVAAAAVVLAAHG